jgi:hypothetical protein
VAAYTSQDYPIAGQAPVYISNDRAASLLGLSPDSIALENDDYSAKNLYKITFQPRSWLKKGGNPTALQLSYPVTVELEPAPTAGKDA